MKITKPILIALLLISALIGVAIGALMLSIQKPSVSIGIIALAPEFQVTPESINIGNQYREWSGEYYFQLKNIGEQSCQVHVKFVNCLVDGTSAGTIEYQAGTYNDNLNLYETPKATDDKIELQTKLFWSRDGSTWSTKGYLHLLENFDTTWTDKIGTVGENEIIYFKLLVNTRENSEFGQWTWAYLIEGHSL